MDLNEINRIEYILLYYSGMTIDWEPIFALYNLIRGVIPDSNVGTLANLLVGLFDKGLIEAQLVNQIPSRFSSKALIHLTVKDLIAPYEGSPDEELRYLPCTDWYHEFKTKTEGARIAGESFYIFGEPSSSELGLIPIVIDNRTQGELIPKVLHVEFEPIGPGQSRTFHVIWQPRYLIEISNPKDTVYCKSLSNQQLAESGNKIIISSQS